MVLPLYEALLRKAVRLIEVRDYGAAWGYANLVGLLSTHSVRDDQAREIAAGLSTLLEAIVEVDLSIRATSKNVVVTEQNHDVVIGELSPHIGRYREILRKQDPGLARLLTESSHAA